MTTFATWICRSLAANGVDLVFGIPGVHTVELYRGLDGSGIRHVTPRHEQGAGFMADGYARVTGKPGVCFIITGPGLTNITTAMGQAYGDSIPMLVISTVSPMGALGSGNGHLHELPDQRQLMEQVAAFSHTILDPAEFEPVLGRALAVFASARPRPVHIEVPVDMLARDVAALLPPPRALRLPTAPAATPAVLDEVAMACATARRPIIVAGGGARHAAPMITALAERLDAPVVMTINGRGILPNDHPLAIPVWPGSPAALQAMGSADLLIAVGTELGPTDFGKTLATQPDFAARIIRCDIDPQQLMRGRIADLPVVADAADFCDGLIRRVTSRSATGGATRARTVRHAVLEDMPARQLAALQAVEILRDTDPEAIIVGDSTQPVYAACTAFGARFPGQFFSSATGYGTLGYGLPAAIGAALGTRKDRSVFCLIGDGGLQFTLPEMGAAVEANAPVIMILWNNSGYGEIKRYMEEADIPTLGVDIYTPDFALLSQGYGWGHVRVASGPALQAAIGQARANGKPFVIEVDEQGFADSCRIGG